MNVNVMIQEVGVTSGEIHARIFVIPLIPKSRTESGHKKKK